MALNPDGSRIVTGKSRNGGEGVGRQAAPRPSALKGHSGGVDGAFFNPDGSLIVTGAGGRRRCGTQGVVLRSAFAGLQSRSIRWFEPRTGSRIVTLSGLMANVWDAKSGAGVLTLGGHTALVHSACFSPDGLWIVTGSDDGSAKVWGT